MRLLQPLSLLLASSTLVPAFPTVSLPSSTSPSQRTAELANSWHAITDDLEKRRYAFVDSLQKRAGGSGESGGGGGGGGISGSSAAGEGASGGGSSGGSSGSSSSGGKGRSSSSGANSNSSTTSGVAGRQGRCWYAAVGAAVIGLMVSM